MTVKLNLLRSNERIVTEDGHPKMPFQNDWQQLAEEVETKLGTGSTIVDAANDAAAAALGVGVGGFYRNGSVVMVRVV